MGPDYTDRMIEPEDGYSRIRRKVMFVMGLLFLLAVAAAVLVIFL